MSEKNQIKPFNSKIKLFIDIVRENMGISKDEGIDESRWMTKEGFEVLADVCVDMFITIAKDQEMLLEQINLLKSGKDENTNSN